MARLCCCLMLLTLVLGSLPTVSSVAAAAEPNGQSLPIYSVHDLAKQGLQLSWTWSSSTPSPLADRRIVAYGHTMSSGCNLLEQSNFSVVEPGGLLVTVKTIPLVINISGKSPHTYLNAPVSGLVADGARKISDETYQSAIRACRAAPVSFGGASVFGVVGIVRQVDVTPATGQQHRLNVLVVDDVRFVGTKSNSQLLTDAFKDNIPETIRLLAKYSGQ